MLHQLLIGMMTTLLLFSYITLAIELNINEEIDNNIISSVRKITDCVTMAMDEGNYEFRSTASSRTCGVYFSTDPNKKIKLTFQLADVGCEYGGLIAVVDGWEMNGHLLPSSVDHPKSISQRIHEFCGNQRPLQYYVSSQNILMIQYRVPQADEGFVVSVEFVENLLPCNVLLQGLETSFTSHNYGRSMNCSVTTLFPSHVDVLDFSVGASKSIHTRCPERGVNDYFEVTGSNDMESGIDGFINVCGSHKIHKSGDGDKLSVNVLCATTTVRLVSSGKHDNHLQMHFRPLSEDDTAQFICEIQ